jgi:hypothetical protein
VGLIESGVDQEAGIQTGGGSYPLLVAGATLIGFMMFQPLRRRVQTWVDRRFNRSRYDTEKVIDGFAGRLQEVVDPEAVTEAWTEAVTTTMQPTTLGVWLRN